jgi:hypothetical protein
MLPVPVTGPGPKSRELNSESVYVVEVSLKFMSRRGMFDDAEGATTLCGGDPFLRRDSSLASPLGLRWSGVPGRGGSFLTTLEEAVSLPESPVTAYVQFFVALLRTIEKPSDVSHPCDHSSPHSLAVNSVPSACLSVFSTGAAGTAGHVSTKNSPDTEETTKRHKKNITVEFLILFIHPPVRICYIQIIIYCITDTLKLFEQTLFKNLLSICFFKGYSPIFRLKRFSPI